MKNRKILPLILVLFVLFQSTILASAGTATISNQGNHQYKSVRLSPMIYQWANKDLSDIRIKDDKGQEVPYFIHTADQKIQQESAQYDMELINSYVKDDAFYFDYKVKIMPIGDVLATSIVAESNETNFAKSVELYGSYDNKNWQKIKDDTLYSVDSHVKTQISFEEPQKYTYYRFKLSNNLENISFDQVCLEYDASQYQEDYFLEEMTPGFTISEQGSNTEITLKGIKNLKLADITIVSDSMFKRMLFTPFGEKEIYHLTFGKETYQDATIPMNWQVSDTDNFVMTIQNNDDVPINIDNIIVQYYADELVFDGSDSELFMLEFGNLKDKTAPEYDIANYQDLALKQGTDSLKITNTIIDDNVEQTVDYKWVFNIVVICIGVLLGGVLLLKVRKTQE